MGGLLGLCIGFSLVSGLELLYWCTVRLGRNCRPAPPRPPTSKYSRAAHSGCRRCSVGPADLASKRVSTDTTVTLQGQDSCLLHSAV